MTTPDGAPALRRLRDGSAKLAVWLAIVAIAGSTALRFVIGEGKALWLDETWTAAIAGQPGFGAFWRQVYLDVNAPLYYLVMHLWQAAFGLSNTALRIPGALFGAAAALVIVFSGVKGLSRPARMTWAALVALWIPGVWLSGDARCYTLLLFLATAQTLAFVRLLRRPDRPRAAIWCALAALTILTHYYAALLAGLQGLVYLAWGRERAVRTWPAALIFLPMVAWLAVHVAKIAPFFTPEIAWYRTLRPERLGRVLEYVVGDGKLGLALSGVAVAALVVGLVVDWRGRRWDEPAGPTARLWTAAAVSIVGAALIVAVGMIRPSFTERYLVPFEPGLFLGFALLAQVLARRAPPVYAAVVVAAVAVLWPWASQELRHGWRPYSWERASADLMRAHPQRLVFLWDHPASRILERDQLDMVGGFFFRRAGRAVEVRSIAPQPGMDPNRQILEQAAKPGSAIIWAYDMGVLGTEARVWRPRLSALDPSLKCRNYSRGSVGVLACDRAGSVEVKP